jgi:hypothetical protein
MTTSKHSDFKISPLAHLHQLKHPSPDKIPALTSEDKNLSSNYPRSIPFITSSNTKDTWIHSIVMNKLFSNS